KRRERTGVDAVRASQKVGRFGGMAGMGQEKDIAPLTGAPLAGLKVIEIGQIAAGPFAGMLLADLGADVVKVEHPQGGDGMRGWPPLLANEDGEVYSGNFASLNRNKRSIA